MATVLFTWELGGGLGHMLPMLPLVEALGARGHRVYVALRELTRATAVFGHSKAMFLQAPFRSSGPTYFPHTPSLVHVLANNGFGDDGELYGLCCAWRNLMQFVRPDVVVFDHSPAALLASRCFPKAKRVVTGLGFFCPPDVAPLPALVDGCVDTKPLEVEERRVLGRVNRTLGRWKLGPVERLSRLYADADETFLTTFEEMDHYPRRPRGAAYCGPVHSPGGTAPQWPDGTGARVYAYLKKCPALEDVLGALAARGGPTIVFADGIDPDVRRRFEAPTLRFETQRLDLARVGAECDVAVHNANHGTLCQLLLAGRPMLQVPITLEQKVLARAVDRLGAAETIAARGATGDDVGRKLDALIAEPRYAEAARRFAAEYASFDPAAQQRRMVERVEGLIAGARPGATRAQVFAG